MTMDLLLMKATAGPQSAYVTPTPAESKVIHDS